MIDPNEPEPLETGRMAFGAWCAWSAEFDGAPDATGPDSFMGYGLTEALAMIDWQDQCEQWQKEYDDEDNLKGVNL
jgi:hypothetical protein